ncbi:MAG: hypothetical protein DRO15_06040 [Thermoprotei archaeon]|mgnify:CR=1 FL=1|nr:MAG: hypothetical protein DRO15_06040 [Thermoprotei archaeon]
MVRVKIGLVIKKGSKEAAVIAHDLAEYGEKDLGLDIYAEADIADEVEWYKRFRLCSDIVDYIVVIGGDGTLLRTLHRMGEHVIPVMTIRVGRRGFLLDVAPFEARSRLRDLVEGRYILRKCLRLQAFLKNHKLPPALNEVAILNWAELRSKVIRLTVYKDNQFIYNVYGDGLIIAPPTGSTAYSLAAGGPILDPELDGYVITPLAPVQLHVRPIVVPSRSKIRILLRSDSAPATCLIDGQYSVAINPGEEIIITSANKPALLVRFTELEFYERIFARTM